MELGTDMKTVADFLDLMRLARDKRRAIVLSLLFSKDPHPQPEHLQLEELLRRLDTASTLTPEAPDKVMLELPGSKSIHMDVKDELLELRKDMAFLADPQLQRITFENVINLCPHERASLEVQAEKVAAMIRDDIPKVVLLTDWDGTMKDYGSNYSTCVQPAYSAVILCRFAVKCTQFAAVLTAGPLRQPGILDLTAVPVSRGFLAYGGCWGREWEVDGQRFVQDSHFSTTGRDALRDFTERMEAMLAAKFPVFRYIGSGFQRKVDRVTFGIQNVSNCVSEEETEALVSAIRDVMKELDPEGRIFHLDRSKYDLEVILSEPSSGVWDKGAGVGFLEELEPAGLELGGEALVLVCGDTASDIPMVRRCLARNPARTRTVFVNPTPAVQEELAKFVSPTRRIWEGVEWRGGWEEEVEMRGWGWRMFELAPEHYVVVSCPQVLHYAMVKLLNEVSAKEAA